MNKKIFKRIIWSFLSIHLIVYVFNFQLKAQYPIQTVERLTQWIRYLASDSLEGRAPTTQGNYLAADFIENIFKQNGIQPFNGSYRQNFNFPHKVIIEGNNNVTFTRLIEKPGLPQDMWKPVDKQWKVLEDWIPLSFSENGSVKGELLFAGYGITASENNYDDYESVDAKDKIVIILTGSPEGEDGGKRFTKYVSLKDKAINARDHGALAIIFVKTQGDSANVFFPLDIEKTFKNSNILALQANRTQIATFFPRDKSLFPLEQKINNELKPQSFLIPYTKVAISITLKIEEKPIPNIIGYVKGTEPSLADEYIIVGAHFDHLGVTIPTGSKTNKKQIHNGADDNASGTAAMMELAIRIANKPLRRPVIFAAFNAEESGLLGSAYYVRNPLVPLENTVFMLNLDMIGRQKSNELLIFGSKTAVNLMAIIDSLGLIDSLAISKQYSFGIMPSDHGSFAPHNIPVVMLFTGIHPDYHMPTDDWDKINYKGMEKIIKFAEDLITTIGNLDSKLEPIKSYLVPIDSLIEDQMPKNYGAWLGIVPDFRDIPEGFAISGTTPGGPAQKAGFLAGDIIKKIDDKNIYNINDFTKTIRKYKPGDKVKITYIRNKLEFTIDVILGKK